MANEKRLDLINKWDVVNKLIQLENNYQFYKEQWDADVLYRRICELEIRIGKTPPADAVEVVHGCWKKEHDDIGIDRGWKCNHCNGSVYEMTYESYQYCPHCGAQMDGDGNG